MRGTSESKRARWSLIGLVAVLASASVAYRVIHAGQLEQTAALFVGLPAVLAIALAFTPRAKSATGIILKGITIALLLSGILLGEGFVCILMAAPLFYLIGCVIGLIVDAAERKRRRKLSGLTYGLVFLPFLPMSLEGTRPGLSFPRQETVTVTREIRGDAEWVEAALARVPRFDRPLPFYLRLGFPRPIQSDGRGLDPGDRRVVYFDAGDEGADLILRVAEHRHGYVRYEAIADRSMIAQWLTWRQAEVRWNAHHDGRMRIEWTLTYERRLDPAWYFGPWER